jgi:disulfide bond formation protein DsbB
VAQAVDTKTRLSKRDEAGDLTSPHGVLSCIAWLLFVIGAILMRVLNGPKTWLFHAATQTVGLLLAITGAGTGIYMATATNQVSSFSQPQWNHTDTIGSWTRHTQLSGS